MRALNVLLAVVVSAVIGLAVLEGGLWLLPSAPEPKLNTFDPLLGWSKKPGAEITTGSPDGHRVHFEFNQHGLREGDDVVPAKPADTLRVIALGDSFTLGRYVEREELFVDLLEDMWLEEGRRIQVVNTGTEAWSTDQEVAWLWHHGAEWQPDVVLMFPYENDVYWNARDVYSASEKPRFTADGELEERELEDHMTRGFFGRTALANQWRRLRGGGGMGPDDLFRPGGKTMLREAGIFLEELPEFMEEPLARTEGAFRALVGLCESLGAELVVVPIPSEAAIDPEERARWSKRFELDGVAWSGDLSVERILDAVLAAGVPAERVLDPRDRLRAKTEAGEKMYFEADWHLNPAGNRELAAFLHQELDRLALLPPGTGQASLAGPQDESAGGAPGWVPWFVGLWVGLGTMFSFVYRKEERFPLGFLKVGALLAVVFAIAVGGFALIGMLPPLVAQIAFLLVVAAILLFVAIKLGDRLETIAELLSAFVGRGHWYLMPLVTVLLTVGSLLVVAASSPLAAPFIYTLF